MLRSFWSAVKETDLPVVLYGTGDAADKLLFLLEERGVRCCGCFASSGFVRNRTFHGYKVLSYSDARRIWGRMAVVMGFGTHDDAVIRDITEIAAENEFYCPSLLLDENGRPFDTEYYESRIDDFNYFRNLLTDERSREIYDAVIAFRITGDIKYILPVGEDETTSWRNLLFSNDESFVDIGAYDGDTVERFISVTGGHYREITAFEPSPRSFRKAEKRLGGKPHLTLLNTPLSSCRERVLFEDGNGRGSRLSSSGRERETTTLDIALKGKTPTILKFDAEGDEEKILEGGRGIISSFKPRIILSVYHRIDDFFRLPRKLLSINGSYTKFTLRAARAIPDWDIILIVE